MADREPVHDDMLAHALSAFLEFSGEALRMMSPGADPADRRMLFRRIVEYEVALEAGNGTATRSPRPGTGDPFASERHEPPAFLQYYAPTRSELREAEARWLHRYDARPATAREYRELDQALDGRIRPDEPRHQVISIDGARYLAASQARDSSGPLPAVVALSDAGILETVSGFRGQRHKDVWLASRQYGRAPSDDGLPLPPVPLSGPASLSGQEEQVLAWLLRGSGPARETAASLDDAVFSAHIRAEIFLAWRSAAERDPAPSPAAVRHELSRRLLRAPDWAAASVGWPFGQIGLAYFDRLTVTPVTSDRAAAALRAITGEAAAARQEAPPVPAQVDRRSLLGRAAARGLVIPSAGSPSPRG